MRIWVDAERAPRATREIVRSAGDRLAVPVHLFTRRDAGSPVDRAALRAWIATRAEPGDVVVTPDTEIGSELARRGVVAIDVRGGEHVVAAANSGSASRLLADVRSLAGGDRGPPPYDERARRAFAATLDRVLARRM